MSNFLKAQITATYFNLTNNESNKRVKLADLKAAFPMNIDAALLEMHRDANSNATMYELDNPCEVTAADQAAAISIISGYPMHIIYIER